MFDFNDVFINFISDFVFWLFLIIVGGIGWLFNRIFLSKFKKVKIKRIDVRNVLKRFNGVELALFQYDGAYKNYIENELVIENSKDDLLIQNLVVDNISVSDRLVSPYKDELYHYLHDEKITSSDFEEVKLRKPELLNSIDRIKTEYNLN